MKVRLYLTAEIDLTDDHTLTDEALDEIWDALVNIEGEIDFRHTCIPEHGGSDFTTAFVDEIEEVT